MGTDSASSGRHETAAVAVTAHQPFRATSLPLWLRTGATFIFPAPFHLGDQVKTSDSIVAIRAPATKVWLALTVPELVKRWQYGSDLSTTWEPGTPITFRNEWNGQVFEQKGTVLEFIPGSRLKYSLFFPRPDLQDTPEHHFFMTYELTESGELTSLLFRQEDPRPSPPDASAGGDDSPDVLATLKELVEVKMP